MQDEMEEEAVLPTDSNSSPDKDSKVGMSRELKSLINSAKESKIINESTQIAHKIRKSRKDLFDSSLHSPSPSEKTIKSRASSANSSSSELSIQKDGKRSMRSQNSDFVIKQKKFLKAVSGKPDWSDDNTDVEDSMLKMVEIPPKSDKPIHFNVKIKVDRYGLRVDPFCWRCHRPEAPLHCSNCPRAYHQRCLPPPGRGPTAQAPWACQECVVAMHASDTSKRSPALRRVTLPKFCELLRHAIRRLMSINGSEPFMGPVDPLLFPDYADYVVNPHDLSKLQENIDKKMYGSTEAFTSDARWILHNCIIFNSMQSKLTNAARAIMKACKQEMTDIETCPECYQNANTKEDWFIQVCEHPHILLWAKLKSFPYWPAKGMAVTASGMVDVRFFGAHDRAWVPMRDCFLYSKRDPNLNNKNKKNEIQQSILEVDMYIENIKTKFGSFNHAPFKTQYIPSEEENQLKILIPNYNSPEGYKHPNFSISTPEKSNSSPTKIDPDSPGSDLVPGDKQTSTPLKINMQPKVVLSYHNNAKSVAQSEAYDTEDEDFSMINTELSELKNDVSLHIEENDTEDSENTANGILAVLSSNDDSKTPDNSTLNDDTKPPEVENPGKRRRRTLSECSSSNPKKPKATSDADNTQTKVPPMRSRGKSIDSRLMLEYMNAVAKNETSFKKKAFLPIAPVQSKSKPNSDSEEVQPDVTIEKPNTPKTVIENKSEGKPKYSTFQVVTTPNSTTALAIIPPKLTGLATIKVTNVCSLLKPASVEPKSEDVIASKPTDGKEEKNVADLLKYKGLKIQRLGPGEPLPADKKIFNVVTKPKQTLNKTMEKLDSLKRSNSLSVNQGKPGSGTIIVNNGKSNTSTITINHNKKSNNAIVSVNPAKSKTDSVSANLNISDAVTVNPLSKTMDVAPPVNGIAETATNSTATTCRITENLKNNIEDADSSSDDTFGNLVIKEEPFDIDDAETEQAKSDKTNLFNSLQLKPNDTISPKFTSTTVSNIKSSPPKVAAAKGVVKKYRSAAEIRDESLAKLVEKSPLLQLSVEERNKITNVLKVVNKHNDGLKTRKIAPKPSGICQIKSVSGGRITLSAKSPEKKPAVTVNGGLNNHSVSSSAELRTNQMVSIPMSVEQRTEPTMATSFSHKSNVSVSSAAGTSPNILNVLPQAQPIQSSVLHSPSLPLPSPYQPAGIVGGDGGLPPTPTLDFLMDTLGPPPNDPARLAETTNPIHSRAPVPEEPVSYLNPFEGAPPDYTPFPSSLGPHQKWLNDSAAKLSDFFRHLMNESLNSLAIQGSPEAMVSNLQLQLEVVKWQSQKKLKELKHNTELLIKEMRASIEGARVKELNEQRLQMETEKIAAVSEAKKLQWCATCERPSSFHCCWNTSYCGLPCQNKHWPVHIKTCVQQTGAVQNKTAAIEPARQAIVPTRLIANRNTNKKVIIARSAAPAMMKAQTFLQNAPPPPAGTTLMNATSTTVTSKPSPFKAVSPQMSSANTTSQVTSLSVESAKADTSSSLISTTSSIFVLGT